MRTFACLLLAHGSVCMSSTMHATVPSVGSASPISLAAGDGACGPERNHCIRPEAGFWIATRPSPGRASPTTPVFERNGEWVSYEKASDVYRTSGYVLRTEVADPKATKRRDVLVVWQPRDGEPRFPDSEEAARSSTRWVVMVVEAVDAANGTFTIEARPDNPFPLAASRRVVEMKELDARR